MKEMRRGHFDLSKVGDSAWRVSDVRTPEDDPARVVAFIECHDRDVEVLWIRGSVAGPQTFRDLDQALDAVEGPATLPEVVHIE